MSFITFVVCTLCSVEMSWSEIEHPLFEPDEQKLLELSVAIQQRFGLELLGIDLIIENATGRYAVIDVNAFPGMTYCVSTEGFVRFAHC